MKTATIPPVTTWLLTVVPSLLPEARAGAGRVAAARVASAKEDADRFHPPGTNEAGDRDRVPVSETKR